MRAAASSTSNLFMATIHNTTMTTGHCVLLTAQYVPSAGLESGGLRAGDEEEGAHGVQFAQGRLALRHLDRRDAQRPDVALWKEEKTLNTYPHHIHINNNHSSYVITELTCFKLSLPTFHSNYRDTHSFIFVALKNLIQYT